MAIELSSTEKEQPSIIIKLVLGLSVLALVAALAIYAYFYFYVAKQQASTITTLNGLISKQKAESGYSEADLRKIEKEVSDYKTLMQGRAKISQLFPAFEQWIHPQIYFTKFALDAPNRTVTLEGVAKDFQPLIQQVAILKNQPLLEKYEIANIAMADTGGVTFSLVLVVKPDVFK